MVSNFFMGLDLGQAKDYTALTLLERLSEEKVERVPVDHGAFTMVQERQVRLPAHYHCRALERYPLGTPYPQIVMSVKERLQLPALRGRTTLVVDATGVGRAVVDLLRAARLYPVPVSITSGQQVTRDDPYWNVPKRDLVGVLQVLLQSKRLKFAETMPLVPTLIQELQGFQVRITEHANDTYGAWREGAHDDLVLSLAVAAWYGERPQLRVTWLDN